MSRKPVSRITTTSSLINEYRSYSRVSPNPEFSNHGACQFPARLACICIAEVGLFLESETEAPDPKSPLLGIPAIAGM
ncbi:hypothetical protein ASPVEDRAFT_47782 [Aspergillus versicolor CBS 583.65]|uniref:Uncharacterized protein n=1 Tax=Aspergillus versicolor CBS 583.65 TaxID=1036611 RepID=A0A1L9Q4G4_ASPVE|nr:uncharacterized protein ASPVEDRAFT_47782 [Aspergillus versicolor CBS 583.65]OJJ08636.1 hypothetical protein ASPVEDRAFT_47782 [Aspergillus versicolor CBS 583.65]